MPQASLGQINQMIVDTNRSGTNSNTFYPIEGWVTDGTTVIGQKRYATDLQVVKDNLIQKKWVDARDKAGQIAQQPSFYFLLTSPNETRDQAFVALALLIQQLDDLVARNPA
ncbi:MAG TPA: hypothetical protein VFU21_02745 [Kofleriaceae bacterium]|nr:hypothetical protein [Kofleriaceae bacterium]